MGTTAERQAYKEKLRSLGFRPPVAGRTKVEEHHTDTAVVTTTEHWHDRQDVNVALRAPITTSTKEPAE